MAASDEVVRTERLDPQTREKTLHAGTGKESGEQRGRHVPPGPPARPRGRRGSDTGRTRAAAFGDAVAARGLGWLLCAGGRRALQGLGLAHVRRGIGSRAARRGPPLRVGGGNSWVGAGRRLPAMPPGLL